MAISTLPIQTSELLVSHIEYSAAQWSKAWVVSHLNSTTVRPNPAAVEKEHEWVQKDVFGVINHCGSLPSNRSTVVFQSANGPRRIAKIASLERYS